MKKISTKTITMPTFSGWHKALMVAILFAVGTVSTWAQNVNVTATVGTLSGSYTTLKGAFDAINAGTHQGTITISIVNSTSESAPCVLNSSGAGSALYSTVSIRPASAGLSVSGATASGRGLIELNGADNVTIDGDAPGGSVGRDLSIINTAVNTTTLTSCVRIATLAATVTSADNNTIKNCILTGSASSRNVSGITSTTGSENTTFGIYCGGNGGTTATTAPSALTSVTTNTAVSGTTINNTVIDNNAINACARAVVFNGAVAGVSPGSFTCTNNTIGGSGTNSGAPPFASPATTVYTKAIWMNGLTAATVTGNTIQNILSFVATTMTGIETVAAIGTGAINISNNTINTVVNNATSTANGIQIASATGTFAISGNTLTNVQATTSCNGMTIAYTGTSGLISNNQITTVRSRSTGGVRATGIAITSGSTVTIQNNCIAEVLNIGSASFGNSFNANGILLAAGNNHKVYHNTVSLYGVSSSVGSNSINCLSISASTQTGIDVRNNIFSNTVTGGAATDAHVCVFLPFTASATMNLTLNNNAYYTGNIVGKSGIAFAGTTAYSSTNVFTAANFIPGATSPSTNFRSFSTLLGVAANDNLSYGSTNAAPLQSATNLHLDLTSSEITSVEQKGAVIGSVTTDIDGQTRPNSGTTLPDMGCDEVNFALCTSANGGAISPASVTKCALTTYTMSAPNADAGQGLTYQWEVSTVGGGVGFANVSGGSGATSLTYTTGPLSPGTYYYRLRVNCSNGAITGYTSNELVVTVVAAPTVAVTPPTGSVCTPGGTAVSLTASGAVSYAWSPTTGLSAGTGANVTANPSTSTTYTVTGTDGSGCTNTATAVISVAGFPSSVAITSSNPSVCFQGNTDLVATATIPGVVSVYNFSTAASGGTLDPMTGATAVIGASDDDTPTAAPANIGFTFNYNGSTFTQYSVSPDGWLLLGGTTASSSFSNGVTLTTNIPKIFPYWDDLATGTDGNVKVLVTGSAPNRIFKVQWFVTIPRNTIGTANSTFQAWLYENGGKIEFRYGTMGADAAGGASVGLTGANVANFQSITVSTNTSSTTVANDNNLTQPTNGRIYTFKQPSVPSNNYNWSPATFLNATNTDSPTAIEMTATTTYTVTASNSGCTSTGTITIPVAAPLIITPTASPATICQGQSTTIHGNISGGGQPYNTVWSSGGAANDTSFVVSPAATTTYTVTVSDQCGVSGTASVTVVVNQIPSISASPGVSTYCVPGAAVALTGSGGVTYAWSPSTGLSATTGTTVNASPSSATVYTVTGTGANGCTATATATVNVGVNPSNLTATATPAAVCPGGNSQLLATAGLNTSVNAYTFTTAASGGTLDPMVGATTVIGTSDDDTPTASPANIGFTFNFNGTTYTQYSVSPDGWILLGGTTASNSFSNQVTLTTNIPKIYPYWDDVATGLDGNVKVLVTGSAPNRIFKVQWFVTIPRNTAGSANSTFQAWLYEFDGKIEFRYGSMAVGSMSASAGLTGSAINFHSITFASNSSSTTTPNDLNADQPANGRIYTYTPPSASFTWSPSTYLTATNIANPIAQGVASTITYTVTAANGACAPTATVTVTTGLPLFANPTPSNACAGVPVTINAGASGGGAPYSYNWSNGAGNVASFVATLNSATTYTVTVTDNCGASTVGSVTVNVNPSPTAAIASNAPVCTAGSLTLNATTDIGTSFAWAGPSSYSSTSQNNTINGITAANAGTYTVTVSTGVGCSATATKVVAVGTDVPTAAASANPSSVCFGGSTTLTGSGTVPIGTYCSTSYANGTGFGDWISLVSIATTTLNNPSGAAASPFYTLWPASGSTTATLVAGNTYSISVSGGTFSTCLIRGWIDFNNNGAFEAGETIGVSGNVGASAVGSFSFTVPAGATNGPLRLRLRGSDTSPGPGVGDFCNATNSSFGETEDYVVTITGGVNQTFAYSWSPSGNLSDPNSAVTTASNIQSASTYTVTVSYNGCTATASTSVSAGIALNVAPSVSAGTICSGTPITVNANVTGGGGPFTYNWTNGGSGASFSATPAANTTYAVTVTDNCGASTVGSVSVIVNASPSVSTTNNTPICVGGTVSLTASSDTGTGFVWSGPGTTSFSSTLTITNAATSATGTYVVTVTAPNGCTSTGGVAVVVNSDIPSASASASPAAVCVGGSAVLTATGSVISGTYCIPTYSSGTGSGDFCTLVQIPGTTLNNPSGASASPFYTLYPASGSTTGTLTAGNNYTVIVAAGTWTANDLAVWIDYNHNGSFEGNEKLGEVDDIGANASASMSFTVPVNALNGQTILRVREMDHSTTQDMDPCSAQSSFGETEDYTITLTGGVNQTFGYAWSPSGNLSNPNASPTTASNIVATSTYTVTVTYQGCTTTASTTVLAGVPLAIAPSATQTTICNGNSTTVSANVSGGGAPYSYSWTNGGSGASFTVSPASTTTYAVTATDNCGNSITGSITVNVNPVPTASAGSNSIICGGNNLNLTTTTNIGNTFSWTGPNGFTSTSQNPVITAATTAATGVYNVTVTLNGCSRTASTSVTVNQPVTSPTATATPSTLCYGNTINLTSSGIFPGYNMNGNSGVAFIDISATGTSVGTTSDDAQFDVTFPFSFNFNGVSYTSGRLSNNGWLVMGTGNTGTSGGFTNACLPQAATAFNTTNAAVICANWDDLIPSTTVTTSIKTQQVGNLYIIQWTNMDNFNATGTGTITFQIQLNGTTGAINIVYQDITYGVSGFDGGQAATIGLNLSASAAVQYSCNTLSLVDGQSITFTPAGLSYAWSGPNSFTSPNQNTSITNAQAVATGTYTVTITATNGCTATATTSATVNFTAANATSITKCSDAVGGSTATFNLNGVQNTVTGGAPGTTVAWYTNAGLTLSIANPAAYVSGTTTVYAKVTTTATGCTNSAAVTLTVNPQPSATATANAILCNGFSTPVTVAAANGTPSYTGTGVFNLPAGSYSYTVTDAAGCTATTSIVLIDGNDVTAPTFTGCPPSALANPYYVQAGVCYRTLTLVKPVATDNCTSVTTTQSGTNGGNALNLVDLGTSINANFPTGSSTITFKATDTHNNTGYCTFNVVVLDTIRPTIANCPANINVNATANKCNKVVNWTSPTSSDNCVGVTMATNYNPGATFNVGTTTVTYTATDGSANTRTCQFTVTVHDAQLPTIAGCPGNISVNAAAGTCAATVNWTAPTAADNCPGVMLTTTNTPGSSFSVGVTNVLYTATDASANTKTCGFSVTVTDNQNPTIVCPSAVTVGTDNGVCTASGVNLGTPNANDNCTVASTTNNGPASYSLGGTTIVWTVTDGVGRTATCTQTITVYDLQAPSITCPAGVTVSTANGVCSAGTTALGSPTTGDNCSVASTNNNAPNTYNLGANTVTWTVTDGSGNTATCAQTVTVEDHENPTITCPSGVTVSTDPGVCTASAATLGTPATGDNCSVASTTNNATSSYNEGDNTVTWTVTDGSGNSATCAQTVTVQDHENPTIVCPDPVTVSADAGTCGAGTPGLGTPTTHDNCSVASTVNDAGSSYGLGLSSLTWTVTDGSGNTATCRQTITVYDLEAPTISCPAGVTVNTAAGVCAAGTTALGSPTTGDNCSVASTTNNASGSYSLGANNVTWTVTDGSGNTATCNQTVTVEDHEAPTISCPASLTVGTDSGACTASGVSLGSANTGDNCSVASTTNNAPGSYNLGGNTVVWTVTDGSGNSATCSQTVTVLDAGAPSIACPGDVTVGANANCEAVLADYTSAATASDLCSSFSVSQSPNAGSTITGAAVLTLTATDAAGNTANCTFNVTVSDQTAPAINCPSDVTVNANANCEASLGNYTGGATASDNCTTPTITQSPTPGNTISYGANTVTLRATDAAGNTAECSFTVTVAPSVTFYADVDGDGFGNPSVSVVACPPPSGYVTNNTDCNDSNNAIYPNAPELCDGLDNNCDNVVDDNPTSCPGATGLNVTNIGTTSATLNWTSVPCAQQYRVQYRKTGEVDWTIFFVNAPANNLTLTSLNALTRYQWRIRTLCDNGGGSDIIFGNDFLTLDTFFVDNDGDGYGNPNNYIFFDQLPGAGYSINGGDCNDNSNGIHPGAAEICNGIDENCNGNIDEGVTTTFYRDQDGDGFGTPTNSIAACSAPSGYVSNSLDCNDSDNSVYFGAAETTCNGIDNDCDGLIDEDITTCPTTSGETASGVTSTSATLNWTGVPCAAKMRIQYRKAADAQWTFFFVNSPATSTTLSGLTPNTKYYWRTRTLCTNGSNSDITTQRTFTTLPMALQQGGGSTVQSTIPAKMDVYPNPSADIFNLDLSNVQDQAVTVQIMDKLGRVAYTWKTSVIGGSLLEQFDLADLPSGVYYVKVQLTDEVLTQQIVKE